MLAGNLASIGVGGIVAVVVSFIVSFSNNFQLCSLSDRDTYNSGQRTLTLKPPALSTVQSWLRTKRKFPTRSTSQKKQMRRNSHRPRPKSNKSRARNPSI